MLLLLFLFRVCIIKNDVCNPFKTKCFLGILLLVKLCVCHNNKIKSMKINAVL